MVCLTFPKAENSWWSSASVVVEEIPPTKTLKSESENIAQKNSESENIIFLKVEIWHQSWKSWTGGDSLDNDYKVKEEMTQKVVQKMPPEKRNKKVTKLWEKNSTRKGVLRQRKKVKKIS